MTDSPDEGSQEAQPNDRLRIRQALHAGGFVGLLDVCAELGTHEVTKEWHLIQNEFSTMRATQIERMLRNISTGERKASSLDRHHD